MQIYWTLKSIPELSHLPWRERGRVWRRAYRKTFRCGATWAALAGCGVIAGASVFVADALGLSSELAAIAVGVFAGIGGLLFSQIAIRVARRHDLIASGF